MRTICHINASFCTDSSAEYSKLGSTFRHRRCLSKSSCSSSMAPKLSIQGPPSIVLEEEECGHNAEKTAAPEGGPNIRRKRKKRIYISG